MTPPDPLIGALFDGRYKILKKLGTGGMATVYLAEDQELGRRIAIKILNAKHASDKQFVERFRREASSAAGLSHPNIVQIYDRGNAEGTYYIAMEVIEGRSLKELVIERGPSPILVAVNYGRQILAALRFAHRNGVVHRDIKPHNVLVDDEGRVKVTDFGIARAGASEMTEVGSIIGTAQYLSPEQARGAPVDDRSDLYSVGVLLYELLTGEAPYNGDTPIEIAMKHLSAVPEPPSAKRPEVPPELDAVVLRALAKHPDDRYQSAEEMDADLSAISKGMEISEATTDAATTVLAGAGLSAPTMISRAPTRVSPPIRSGGPTPPPAAPGYYDLQDATVRRPVWPWLLALLLAAAVGVAFWIVYRQLSENSPVPVPSVTGLTERAAKDKITNAGLTALAIPATSSTTAQGKVFDQRPNEGERIAPNSTVRIWVSVGTNQVRVKSVVGMESYTAISTLQQDKFVVETNQAYDDAKDGTVFKQDPLGNEKAAKGSTVTIWVSKGPKPIPVPDVVGTLYNVSYYQLKGQGFKISKQEVDSSQPKGTITDQSPDANTLAPPGSTITLTVSTGSQLVTVPDVTSFDAATAESTLTSQGFSYNAVPRDTPNPDDNGIVLDQTPPGNKQAAVGSTVTIYVGNYVAP
ncbi:MAG: Stk1 family PASTA domain-containing Ser/Thr kinase [Gaiellaceae bacterium]